MVSAPTGGPGACPPRVGGECLAKRALPPRPALRTCFGKRLSVAQSVCNPRQPQQRLPDLATRQDHLGGFSNNCFWPQPWTFGLHREASRRRPRDSARGKGWGRAVGWRRPPRLRAAAPANQADSHGVLATCQALSVSCGSSYSVTTVMVEKIIAPKMATPSCLEPVNVSP